MQGTSLLAYDSVKARAPRDAAQILVYLLSLPKVVAGTVTQWYEERGATCEQVEGALALSHQTCSARIRGLVQAGKLRNSGRRRQTRSGRQAIVWEPVR